VERALDVLGYVYVTAPEESSESKNTTAKKPAGGVHIRWGSGSSSEEEEVEEEKENQKEVEEEREQEQEQEQETNEEDEDRDEKENQKEVEEEKEDQDEKEDDEEEEGKEEEEKEEVEHGIYKVTFPPSHSAAALVRTDPASPVTTLEPAAPNQPRSARRTLSHGAPRKTRQGAKAARGGGQGPPRAKRSLASAMSACEPDASKRRGGSVQKAGPSQDGSHDAPALASREARVKPAAARSGRGAPRKGASAGPAVGEKRGRLPLAREVRALGAARREDGAVGSGEPRRLRPRVRA